MTRSEELSLPTRHGEVLCVPEFGRWLEVAEQNARRLESQRVLRELREQARRELVQRAGALLERWGLHRPEVGAGPWVGTGHQPALYHPGIWIRTWAVAACQQRGAVGVHVGVDSDECERFGARVPRRDDGRLRVVERVLAEGGRDVPFECLPAPAEEAWRAFCARLQEDVATLGLPEVEGRLARAERAGLASLARARHLGEFGAGLRRHLELDCAPVRYLEVTASELSRTRAFARFASWIAQDAERFWACHNQALEDYRRQQDLRSPAQPFPNLRRESGRVELPFWLVRDGVRQPVFVQPNRPPVAFCRGAAVGELSEEGLEGLRPRAVTLTLFLRLAVCDLFVHGLGGARYDRVTDRLVREFFDVEPPPFAVLTATYHLPLARHPDPRAAYQTAQRLWQDLHHNPDRHLPRDGEVANLVEEKWRCIQALEAPGLPRRTRRELTQRIRALNEALRARLQDRIRQVEAELESLRRDVEEHQVAADRTYPFFLFDPELLRTYFRAREEARCR